MEGPRPEKVAVVEEVRERLSAVEAAFLTEYRGLSVSQMATLRSSLRRAGGEMKVYKNTLVRFAARDAGLDVLQPLLMGPTAIAFVDGDVADVARALRDFARTNPPLVIKGGLLGGNLLSSAESAALAELPSKEALLARLAGALAAPLQRFAALLQAMPQNLAYGLAALRDQRDAAEAPEAPPEAAATEGAEQAAATEDAEAPRSEEPEPEPPEAHPAESS